MVTVYKSRGTNMSKKIKKALIALALAGIVGVSVGASACGTSKHPNARITIEFNEETYVIDYMLYRNMYPQTVQHFIELADAGFYNDTIVHDYKSSDWVSGAYSYNAKHEVTDDAGNSTLVASDYVSAFSRTGGLAEYLEANSKEKEYYDLVTAGIKSGSFSASVYSRTVYDKNEKEIVDLADALPTVIGEFSENGHKIADNKGLKDSYGTLKMVYYKKDVKPVFVKNSFDQILPRDYSYNCATSLFSMQVSNSTQYSASKYAVFGQLKNDKSKEILEDLTDAISDYATSLGSSSSWSLTVKTQVDKEDKFADEGGRDIDVSFTMTSLPLIIRSVKITKY